MVTLRRSGRFATCGRPSRSARWATASPAYIFAALAATYLTGHLCTERLFVTAFLTGAASVFFDIAYQAYLPSIVERASLVDGNSKLETNRSVAAHFVGQVLRFLGPAGILVVDGVSYLVSALLLLGARVQEAPPDRASPRERLTVAITAGRSAGQPEVNPHPGTLRWLARRAPAFGSRLHLLAGVVEGRDPPAVAVLDQHEGLHRFWACCALTGERHYTGRDHDRHIRADEPQRLGACGFRVVIY